MRGRTQQEREGGGSSTNVFYVRPNRWIPVLCWFGVVLIPLMAFDLYQEIVLSAGFDVLDVPQDGLSWERAFETLVTALALLVFFLGSLLVIFHFPRHIWIDPEQVRWTTPSGLKKCRDLNEIERVDIQQIGGASLFGKTKTLVSLKFRHRRLRLQVGTRWAGAAQFCGMIRKRRPDLFSEIDLDQLFGQSGE